MRWSAIGFALLLASCGGSGAPEVAVSNAWSRPTLTPAQPGAVYLKIANDGNSDDRLIGVGSDGGTASLHTSTIEEGVVRMRPLPDGLAIPAGSTVELKPHGPHIMLERMAEPLRPTTRFQLTLKFEKSGERRLEVQVADGVADQHGGHE